MKSYGWRTKATANGVPIRINRADVTKRRDTTDTTDTGTVPDGEVHPKRERTTGLEEVEVTISGFLDPEAAGPDVILDMDNPDGVTLQFWPHGLDFPSDIYYFCKWDQDTRRHADPNAINTFEGHLFCSQWEEGV